MIESNDENDPLVRAFYDVPADNWAGPYIESLLINGITSGCGNHNYCPDEAVTRGQMAVFVLRGMFGFDFTPPAVSTTRFSDVPMSHTFAAWIEAFAAARITAGCGGGRYCPNDAVTRAQMAVFLLRAMHGSNYQPPALPAGGSPFADVDTNDQFAPWIAQLADEGITSGCGNGNFCPNEVVTRAQMAVFIVRAFQLTR